MWQQKENQNFVWQEMPNYGLSVTTSKHTVKYPSKNNSEETALGPVHILQSFTPK